MLVLSRHCEEIKEISSQTLPPRTRETGRLRAGLPHSLLSRYYGNYVTFGSW